MARIRKHRNKWQVLYRDPATGRERSAGTFTRKSDATRQRKAVEYKTQTGEWIDPTLQATPYGEWAKTWLDTKTHLKPKTLETYESLFNSRILPRFGDARLRDIRAIDVEQWISTMHEEGLSPLTIRKAHGLLSQTFKAAIRNRMLPNNPAEGASLPRTERKEMLYLSPDQVQRLSDAIPDEHEALIYTLAYAGIRQGEATALRRGRVNLLRRELVIAESATNVHGSKVFSLPKNGKTRTVPIPTFLAAMIAAHLEHVPPEPDALVFTNSAGGPMDWSNFRRRVWAPAREVAHLDPKLRIHDLRHTAASILIAQGAHPKVIQEHLGHSSIVITMDRYGHLYPEDRSKVTDALDAAFAAARAATA
jgi:integrase